MDKNGARPLPPRLEKAPEFKEVLRRDGPGGKKQMEGRRGNLHGIEGSHGRGLDLDHLAGFIQCSLHQDGRVRKDTELRFLKNGGKDQYLHGTRLVLQGHKGHLFPVLFGCNLL